MSPQRMPLAKGRPERRFPTAVTVRVAACSAAWMLLRGPATDTFIHLSLFSLTALVSKKISGGVALLIYARQSLSSQISEVLTAYMPCGPLWMSNKGKPRSAIPIALSLADVPHCSRSLQAPSVSDSR